MKRVCGCKETRFIRVETEVGADPLWCGTCLYNLDLDLVEICDSLKGEFYKWNAELTRNPNFNLDKLEQHNRVGKELTARLKEELGSRYTIEFKSIYRVN